MNTHRRQVERHGLMTHSEIARRLGISKTRVLMIEQRALQKLRAAFLKQGVSSAEWRDVAR